MKVYEKSGVSIKKGDDLVNRIKSHAKGTFTKGVLSQIGHFGAFFDADFKNFKKPVLVSSVDGVGTKLKVAQLCNKYDTIGQDLVNHCVN
ncbi:MAG: phosphoribosylformylglycinamidine cyclo-ligase, partial [Ignavibacteria bacterium]|nr:phosphoribosylformylglycinamidine cyclo-ligase [Ignavibacteria bacterium]